MKILVNYNFTPDKDWLGDDYLMYDRSDTDDWLKDFPREKIIRTVNIGQVDYDKLGYLIENYYNLPEVFLWGKTNLFKYISKEEYDKVKDNKEYTPLLTQNHKTYRDEQGVVCFYEAGMYNERNDSWYVNTTDYKYFETFDEFARSFHLPSIRYLPFAPGGNYILTREKVHKYSVDFYEGLREILPHAQNPAEAHMCERAYHLIWR